MVPLTPSPFQPTCHLCCLLLVLLTGVQGGGLKGRQLELVMENLQGTQAVPSASSPSLPPAAAQDEEKAVDLAAWWELGSRGREGEKRVTMNQEPTMLKLALLHCSILDFGMVAVPLLAHHSRLI